MQKRLFKKGDRQYIYDPETPEIMELNTSNSEAIWKSDLKPEANSFYTAFLPEDSGVVPENMAEILETPVKEAWCTPEFWQARTTEEWLQALLRGKDHLLIHAPAGFWETLTISHWLELHKGKRQDLLMSHLPGLKNFSTDKWFQILTAGSDMSIYFSICPEQFREEFKPKHWKKLFLHDPDFYLGPKPKSGNTNILTDSFLKFFLAQTCGPDSTFKLCHLPQEVKKKIQEKTADFFLQIAGYNYFAFKALCPSPLKWYIGSDLTAFLAALFAFFVSLISAKLSGIAWLPCIGVSVGCALFAFVFFKSICRRFYLNKKQTFLTGICGGPALCAIMWWSLFSPTPVLMLSLPLIFLISGIAWSAFSWRKNIINCCTVPWQALLVPGFSLVVVVLTIIMGLVSTQHPANQCLKIARNFRFAGMLTAERMYMQKFIAQNSQYQKKLKEFDLAVERKNFSDSLSAYDALADIWPENPALADLASRCTLMVKNLTISPDQKNIDLIARARKTFGKHSEKSVMLLTDIELALRNGQLTQVFKKHQKSRSFKEAAALFADWQNKLAAVEALDKNYAALGSLKEELFKIRSVYEKDAARQLTRFEQEFDQKFPPEKNLAALRKNLSLLSDIYQGFSHLFSENATLKYGWLLALVDRKSGLEVLTQKKSLLCGFLSALFNSGAAPDKFSELTDSDIFRTVTARKAAEAEKFFRFLLARYNFKPNDLYYLVAFSEKIQKKNFTHTLEAAILNDLPDRKGYYLAWNDERNMKIPVLEKIVKNKMTNWQQAAAILGDKYLQAKDYSRSYAFYMQAGNAAAAKTGNINKAYFEGNKTQLLAAVRQFILEFDRIYTNSSACRPPVNFEYKRCYEFLTQDFMWRYAWAAYQHAQLPAVRNEARALLEKIKSPESVYLLAKIDNFQKELPIEAVNAGASAKFKKIRLEATKYKLTNARFSNREKIDGIKYLFEEGELSVQEKLYAGQFLIKQNDLMSARKIFDSLPPSGDKSYHLFLCDITSGNKASARQNLIAALKQAYPVPYDQYKRIEKTDNKELMPMLVKNKGPQFQLAALDFARILSRDKEWLKAAVFFQQADADKMTVEDKGNYGFSLWERGSKTPLCFDMCLSLPDERIGSDLAWHIHLHLQQKKDPRSEAWLKNASSKGSPDAENKRYLQLRRDDSVENVAEKNKLWKNCIQRGFETAVVDAVNACSFEEPCPVSKEIVVRSGELFFNRLSPADQKKHSKLKEKIIILKEL